jgi:fructokinase
MDIITLGELLVDFFPLELGKSHAEVSGWRKAPGGAPANVAVAAARLGARSGFIGKVGEDPFGHWLIDVVAREGVDTRGMAIDPNARTTLSIMAMPDADHYDCMFYRNPGADMMLRPEDLDESMLGATRAFHFGSLSLTDEPARSAALAAARIVREVGGLVSFDVNYRPTLWREPGQAFGLVRETIPLANVLKVNEAELALLTGLELDFAAADWQERVLDAASRLLELGPTLIIVTLGPNGALFRTRASGGYVPGFRVTTVDATGCGDAFIAALLWQLVREGRGFTAEEDAPRPSGDALLPEILRYANAVGALTATKQGVIPSLPTAAEVEEFLLNQA